MVGCQFRTIQLLILVYSSAITPSTIPGAGSGSSRCPRRNKQVVVGPSPNLDWWHRALPFESPYASAERREAVMRASRSEQRLSVHVPNSRPAW